MIKIISITLFTTLLLLAKAYPQQPYFVDGYHGGIYGHYPLWVTQFMLDKLAKHPEWKLGLEIEPETWDSVQRNTPEAYRDFKRIVTDQRIEFTNPTYAQPYCYNISGESIIRQFTYGIKKMQEHFPEVNYTTYAVEEPCFTSSLPQILKQFGFKYAVLKTPNTCWGGYMRAHGGQLVNWTGPDGSAILTVPRYSSEALEENSTWQTTAWNNSLSFLQASAAQGIVNPVGMCYQDAGWRNGPWLGHGDHIKNKSIYVTWKEYIEQISTGKTDDSWRLSQEDILVNLMWGSQALQRIGQAVRKSENKILMAEKVSAMANIDNQYIPAADRMDDAWRTLMMAQHHDSWIVPYNKLDKDQTWEQAISQWTDHTNKLSDDIVAEAMSSYHDTHRSTDKLGFIRVFNTVGANRAEVVRVKIPQRYSAVPISLFDSKNEPIPSVVRQEDGSLFLTFKPTVSGFGYSTYALREKKQRDGSRAGVRFDAQGDCIIANDMYQITLDKAKGGTIKSLVVKHANNKEFANQDTMYRLGEIAGHFYDEQRFYSSKQQEARITVLQDNAFLSQVKVEGYIASHPFTQIITLEAGQKRIDFDLKIDWEGNVGIGEYKQEHNWTDNRRAYTDDRYKLKIMFPNSLNSPTLYKNAPFDVCESRLDSTFFGKWDEIKHNVILNWIDLTEEDNEYGLTVLSDHTTSYVYGPEYPLSLTAQYSGIGLWGVNYGITEALHMKFALVPHTGKWDEANIPLESASWNEPLLAGYHINVAMKDRTFVDTHESGFEISTMKVEKDNILLRLFNSTGNHKPQRITLHFPVSRIQEVLLNEQIVQQVPFEQHGDRSTVSISMPRFGIKTLSIQKLDN
ncbi:glycoside hydrolase family 38 N-terminal domain-containing protein [Sphingobacterium pedocola]|uniref:Alpha-mannosidase n=1 Tax=Sphingobacterium pedocola TaxID=2082722 RepID=A0ABR9TBQ3_9SPHI|nr:glycoside hydrolase family 38 C-terminal domain-containing protein [Sphingobacterium pedocola]MBE8722744.1 alpha-mannosidase [Sphingobacterium pedocola]